MSYVYVLVLAFSTAFGHTLVGFLAGLGLFVWAVHWDSQRLDPRAYPDDDE